MNQKISIFKLNRIGPWVIILLIFIYLFGFGNRGLNEPDEGRYANISLEMLEPGVDHWDPQFSDTGHYDKPPLIYWLCALSINTFGRQEWAARLPSLLGALMTFCGLAWAGRRLYPDLNPWHLLLMAGTTLQLWLCARLLTPDMLLTGFTTLAIAAWAETRYRGGGLGFYLLQILFWALAFWTKATPALIPFAGLTLYVLLSKDPRDRRALRPFYTLPAFLLLGTPWYLYILHKHPELTDFFFKRELVGRVMGHADGRRGLPGYHFFIALLAWLPWWPLWAFSVWKTPGKKTFKNCYTLETLGPEGVVALTGLVIFSFVSSKLSTYILTLTPWAVLHFARRLPMFSRWLWQPVAVMAALFISMSLLLPRYETSLDKNSSMRLVVQALRAEQATTIYAQRHFSGLEFYWGDDGVYYLEDAPVQLSKERLKTGGHFVKDLSPEGWLILLRRDREKYGLPEDQFIETDVIQIGDFDLIKITPLLVRNP
jgi:4-amino-4-deoxy-L-arabinose transferase-like glycosyltransferase